MSDSDHWSQPLEEARNADAAYWQGHYHGPEYGWPEADDDSRNAGSMSMAARQSYANEAIRRKDHVSAGLLALFLGVFGVHKFYLGCNNAGFIMLTMTIIGGMLTFGLAAAVIWLIAIIEGVIYLTKSQTDFDRIYVLNQRDWF